MRWITTHSVSGCHCMLYQQAQYDRMDSGFSVLRTGFYTGDYVSGACFGWISGALRKCQGCQSVRSTHVHTPIYCLSWGSVCCAMLSQHLSLPFGNLASVYLHRDEKVDKIAGQCFIPALKMRAGYRTVPLLDAHNKKIPGSSLLVRVGWQKQSDLYVGVGVVVKPPCDDCGG